MLYLPALFLLVLISDSSRSFDVNKVIYAINAGGDSFVDSLGIKYEKDPLHQKVGVASDYGKSLTIRRVPDKDYELYQVERYHHSSFSYEIPIMEDGDYVLVLKFCEVYFMSKNSKVFDVALNGVRVIENLDIFNKVGRGTAHDEYIPFRIKDNVFVYKHMESIIKDGKMKVEFLKGRKDNPKINAIIVYKGTVLDFPKLHPLSEEEKPQHLRKRPLGKSFQETRIPENPYMYEDLISSYWPLLVTVASVVPVIFCLYFPKLPRVQFEEKIIKFEYPDVKLTKNKKPDVPKNEVNRNPHAIDHPAMLWPVCIIMLSMFSFFYYFCRV